jgi:hypothetical protein
MSTIDKFNRKNRFKKLEDLSIELTREKYKTMQATGLTSEEIDSMVDEMEKVREESRDDFMDGIEDQKLKTMQATKDMIRDLPYKAAKERKQKAREEWKNIRAARRRRECKEAKEALQPFFDYLYAQGTSGFFKRGHNNILVGTSSGAWFYPPEAMASSKRETPQYNIPFGPGGKIASANISNDIYNVFGKGSDK